MDPYQRGQVEMFVNITGASEADARERLRVFSGDLNAAIDSYLSEKENIVSPVQVEEAGLPVWGEEDEPPHRQRFTPTPFFRLPSALAWTRGQRGRGFGFAEAMAPSFPFRGTSPVISQPRDIQEIPIDWREESRVQSSAGLLIEEIPATAEETPPLQRPAHFITDAEEDTGPLPSASRSESYGRPRSGGNNIARDLPAQRTNLNAPSISESRTMGGDEDDDVEEDILRAVIEASEKETRGMGISEAEDDDFARAVSLSLKSAEEEKAVREGKDFPWFLESSINQNYTNIDDHEKLDISKGGFRRGSSSARMKDSVPFVDQASDAPAGNAKYMSGDQAEVSNQIQEQSSLRRQAGSSLNSTVTSSDSTNSVTSRHLRKEPNNAGGKAVCASDSNGNAKGNNEWAGLSSAERDEAVVLEAAIFGSLPENIPMRFRYPSVAGGTMEEIDGDLLENRGSHINSRPMQQPPSPTVVAERLLREQQDFEYLTSLVADREKEERARVEEEARFLKEAEVKADAHAKEKLKQEEDLRTCLAEKELQKQVVAKRAALPAEPSLDDDNAVTLMVRMPDGTRQGRRFRKSENLQCLIDFIDVSCGPLPGSYQLVRPYPRKAFSDAEHGRSFLELGLNSKYETLFLELV